MSISGNFDLVSNHHFVGLLKDIGIATDDKPAIDAVEYLYKLAIDEYSEEKNSVNATMTIANNALERAKTRYGLLLKYENLFYSSNYPYNRPSLVKALMLDCTLEYVEDKNDDCVLTAAKEIWEQAAIFKDEGYQFDANPMEEAVFLAHVNMMERLLIAEHNFDELGVNDITVLLRDEVPIARKRAQNYHAFGQELSHQADIVEERLKKRLKELQPRPQLKLVVDNTPPLPQ